MVDSSSPARTTRPPPRRNTSPVKLLTNRKALSNLSAGHEGLALPDSNMNLPFINDPLTQFPSQNRALNFALVVQELTLARICEK